MCQTLLAEHKGTQSCLWRILQIKRKDKCTWPWSVRRLGMLTLPWETGYLHVCVRGEAFLCVWVFVGVCVLGGIFLYVSERAYVWVWVVWYVYVWCMYVVCVCEWVCTPRRIQLTKVICAFPMNFDIFDSYLQYKLYLLNFQNFAWIIIWIFSAVCIPSYPLLVIYAGWYKHFQQHGWSYSSSVAHRKSWTNFHPS